ncbi:MAG: hypothetical protein AAFX40_03180 [Cyanobacteria bacterium J06639_1]
MLTRLWRSIRAGLLCLMLVWLAGCSNSSSNTVDPVIIPSQPIPIGNDAIGVPLTVRSFNLGSSQLKLLSMFVSVASGDETDLLLDTGSSGMRVLSSEAGTTNLVRTGRAETVRFGDGTELRGELATAPVSFSTIGTEQPVLIHLVDSVTCSPSTPDCPGSSLFGANAPFKGIVGASLNFRTNVDDLFSPFTRLEGNLDSGYIIETGGFNAQQGRLIFGITNQTSAGFTRVPLSQRGTFSDGTPFWDDDEIQAEYTVSGTDINGVFDNTLLDCGSSDLFLASRSLNSTFSEAPLVPNRTVRSFVANVFDLFFTTGNTPGLDRVFVDPVFSEEQILGMPFFFRFDTLFDVDGGQLGVRAR